MNSASRRLPRGMLFSVNCRRAIIYQTPSVHRRSCSVRELAVGKSADIIAMDGNPLDDIRATERVRFVMARGAVIRQD